MANYHSDSWVYANLNNHLEDALTLFSNNHIVGLFCQGSTNYQLDTPNSDVDTKLIVLPSFKNIAFNTSPVSTTHVRKDNSHIDIKDLRLMLQTFRKQNINFIEILFTKYHITNPTYEDEWNKLTKENEKIARYNIYRTIQTMRGMAKEKYHALEHPYPSKLEILKQYGYDGKQLHHLLRLEEFLKRYIAGEAYADCLISKQPEFLKAVKTHTYFTLEAARDEANKAMNRIEELSKPFTKDSKWNRNNPEVEELLDEVQYNIMRQSIKEELL